MNQETIQLIGQALDGTIAQDEFSRLQELLRSDDEAMDYYCQQSEICGRLTWELGASSVDPMGKDVVPFFRRVSVRLVAWSGIAAAVAVSVGYIHSLRQQVERTTPSVAGGGGKTEVLTGSYQVESSLARVTNLHDARWQGRELNVGSWIKPGTLHLLSGQAEITFDSGASVVLQGPAKLSCLTPHLAKLLQGKGAVHIPNQAEGFRLKTPSGSFADQACSFALAVDDGGTEIHVMTGTIEASPRNNMTQAETLYASESLRMNEDVMLTDDAIRYAAGEFQMSLPVDVAKQHKSTFLRWSFDSMQMGSFPESGNTLQVHYPAQIEQLKRIPGESQALSIKGKFGQAIRFNGRGSYLATQFEGISGATERTVACWVRIPKGTSQKNAYSIFAWGEPQSQTGTKWQIAWNPGADNQGRYGALRTEFGGGYVIGSTNLRDGRWHHITSVYLGGTSDDVATQILHYVDGKLETVTASKHQKIDTKTSQENTQLAYIGRRLEDDRAFISFKGDIDELHVFPAALTPYQINQLYRRNEVPKNLIPAVVVH